MEDKKITQTLFLTFISFAVMVVAITGATFAYFSLSVVGNSTASSIYVTTGVLGNVNFTDGSAVSLTNINPNNNPTNDFTTSSPANYVSKTFTISNSQSAGNLSSALTYYIFLVPTVTTLTNVTYNKTVSSGATNSAGMPWFGYKLSYTSNSGIKTGDTLASNGTWTAVTSSQLLLGSGTFAASTTGNAHSYKLEFAFFNDDKASQDSVQGLSYTAKVQVSLSSSTSGITTSLQH